jgi:hypothetical protein
VAQLAKRGEGTPEGAAARCGHSVELLPAATALSGRLTEACGDETFGFEPEQSGVHRTEADDPSAAARQLLADADAVPLVGEAKERNENELFELAEIAGGGHRAHLFDYVSEIDAGRDWKVATGVADH